MPTLVTQFTVTSALVGGQAYLFRLQAENVYGWGPNSTDTLVYAAGVPAQPPPAVTAINGANVRITWQSPANTAAPITAYRVFIRQADGNFAEDLASCDGSDPAIRTALTCDVPLPTLRAAPFSLVYGALVQVRVQAQNANDWGKLSQVNVAGATVQTPPVAMLAPTMGSSTATTSLHLEFSALAFGIATGGATIDSYNLQWDQGTGAFVDLLGQDGSYQLATSHTVSSGVVGGGDYRIRVRAHNVHGWGPYSPEAIIYATSQPSQPAAVTTAAANENILISWTTPFNNYEALDAYRVSIKTSSGTFETETTHCDGSSAPVFFGLSCLVPVSVLTAAPFSLSAGDVVQAVVEAHNARGWGPASPENTAGAIIITVPHQMGAPLRDGTATTIAYITVNWTKLAIPQNGMTPVLSYNLEWDSGSSSTSWTELVGYSTDYLLDNYTVSAGIVPGGTYRFRVRARNSLGWGAYSPETAVKAATVPEQMAMVTTEVDPLTGGVKITFTSPYDNAQTILAYKIEVKYNPWQEESVSCSGADATIMSSFFCIMPMSTLRGPPYNLTYGEAIQVRAQAYNAYGWGAVSTTASTVTIRTEPQPANQPVRGDLTTPTLLHLTWVPLTTAVETGDSAILSYNVQWDAGTGGLSWYNLQGYYIGDLSTSVQITTGVAMGLAYQVRVRARNIYGYGNFSAVTTIRAAQEPDTVLSATLSSVVNTTNVTLSWTPPGANNDTITAYRILILQKDGGYSEELTYCNGADAEVLAAAICHVPF